MTRNTTHATPARTTMTRSTIIGTLALGIFALASPAFAQQADTMMKADSMKTASMTKVDMTPHTADFVRFNKTLNGSITVVEDRGQTLIRFSDDFRASNGPDLKIFLSPQGLDTVSGKTATRGSVQLDELQRNRGTQDYVVPAGVNLSEFASVLVHCEQFSVLWGGAALS